MSPTLLGFLAATCSIPGYTGVVLPAQWTMLSVALLPSLWTSQSPSLFHWLGLFFVGWAWVTSFWSPNTYTSVLGLWYVCVWGLSFWYGSTQASLGPLFKGLALGVSVSCIIALFEAFGYASPFLKVGDYPAGLFFNPAILGAVCACILLGCLAYRLWYMLPVLALGIGLSHSRGAVLVLAVGLATRLHWLLGLSVIVAFIGYMPMLHSDSDLQRYEIWSAAGNNLSLLGWGPDSFNDVYYILTYHLDNSKLLFHLEFAHNDYLQLLFEYGLGAILPFIIFGFALSRSKACLHPLLFAWACLALFLFPLYHPLLAFIGCAVAGHLLRGYDPLRKFCVDWGYGILLWNTASQSDLNHLSRDHLPVVP